MGRALTLLILLILTLSSLTGYLILTKKIISGQVRIALGEKQLAQGEQMLAQGKAKLANGERQLASGKNIHNTLKSIPVVGIASVLPVGAVVAVTSEKITHEKVAEGDQLVAKGKEKVRSGETQLKAGKLELQQGIARLNQAKGIRLACAIGTVVFSCLLMICGFYWRGAVVNTFKSML